MKTTKKRVIFFVLHVLFSAIVPITLVIIRYSSIGQTRAAMGFKVGITGILLLLFLFWVIKRLFIDKILSGLNEQCNNIIADLKTEQNEDKIKQQEREIKSIRTIEAVVGSIMPLLFLLAALIAFKALEAQLIKLSATLGLIAVSIFIGLVFNVLYSRQIAKKHKKEK